MTEPRRLDAATLERLLEVTRRLARPIDLQTLLAQVIDVAREVLDADRGTVFLYEAETHEFVVSIGTGLDTIRVPADKGFVGECAQSRAVVNVPDCYADPRFNPEVDLRTGYRTNCLLTVPLVDQEDELVGVLQILNKKEGTFDAYDEWIAEALAAQCAVALQRARMTEALVVKERMDRELAVAREIQTGFLPSSMPVLPGHEIAGMGIPAEETGGDMFDVFAHNGSGALILVADATGHGVGPALSATQVRAMLRVAARLDSCIDEALTHVNDQLDQDLASNRFVTAFVGVLDPENGRVRYHSAGQAPILHFRAETGECVWLGATAPPLGMLSPLMMKEAVHVELAPGDILAVMTDGVFECVDPDDEEFGQEGVARLLAERHADPLEQLVQTIQDTVRDHRRGAPPDDDVTVVLLRRNRD
jgi:phosphoserine phosphatase